jgi:hypothetical protein
MKLIRPIDYRGFRPYASDRPSAEEGSWLIRLLGRLAAWTKRKLALALRSDTGQAPETAWRVQDRNRHFSLSGSEYERKARLAVAPRPFSHGEGRPRRPIGYQSVED